SKCTKIYQDAILERGDKPFDEAWMQETFNNYWDVAEQITLWTNTMLSPPPPHILKFLGAASKIPSLAKLFANNFNDPRDNFPWWIDPEKTEELIEQHSMAS
ncbi:MAG: alanine-phosphoribitol ligase, partial [Gammaproteobacteria bacterium]